MVVLMFVEYVLMLENLFAVTIAQLLSIQIVWVMKDSSLVENGSAISARLQNMESVSQ